MLGKLAQEHIKKRLKAVQAAGIILMLLVFFLLFALNYFQSIDTLAAQIVALAMGGVIALGYLSVLPNTNHEVHFPLLVLYVLTILNSL